MSDTFKGAERPSAIPLKNIESSQNLAVWEIIGNFVEIFNQYNF